MSRIVLGVAGGIAAYKACDLLRRLRFAGHDVTVVPTAAALHFVGAATWAALSGRPVQTEVWADAEQVPHVRIGQRCDLVLVAPATADLLARAAGGRADDLLTNVLLTAPGPAVFAPAMHTEMWRHPATRDNVATLRRRGSVVLDPDVGRLTGADSGAGRLPEPAELAATASLLIADPTVAARAAAQDLAGLRVVVSAGGTREHLDPVRFLGNASSGRMGWALARAARLRGAEVHLVAANVDLPPPAAVQTESVTSTADLQTAMQRAAERADLVVMAAAPADYTPARPSATKLKKSGTAGLELSLTQTVDVLADLVARRTDPAQVLVGFAAETVDSTDELIALGRAKLDRKGCDLLVLNAVGPGLVFGSDDSEIVVLGAGGDAGASVEGPFAGSKDLLAHRVWDSAISRRTVR